MYMTFIQVLSATGAITGVRGRRVGSDYSAVRQIYQLHQTMLFGREIQV